LVDSSFLEKLKKIALKIPIFSGKPSQMVGVDIGMFSTKVVQLRYESGRAVLETYGELLNGSYLKEGVGIKGGFLQYQEDEIVALLKDILRESHVTSKDVVISIPAASSFIVTFSLPNLPKSEVAKAVPYEARKYIPVPIKDIILDWDVIESGKENGGMDVLLVAVPKEVVEKIKRVSEKAGLTLRSMEIESFSMIRALMANDLAPTAIVNVGYQSTVLVIVDQGQLRVSDTIMRGSHEWTRAIMKGLSISSERAEEIKKEIGLGKKVEDKEISNIVSSLADALFLEIERMFSFYHRKTSRRVQKINLTGGGSNLKGLVEEVASRFEIEVGRSNPFSKIVAPAFMQPVLREIGPGFTVAVGLALRELSNT